MRIVVRKPVRSMTVTHELTMENQWISRCCGRKELREYLSMRCPKGTVEGFQEAE